MSVLEPIQFELFHLRCKKCSIQKSLQGIFTQGKVDTEQASIERGFHFALFVRQIMKIVRSPSNMVSIEMNTVYIIQNHQSSIKNYVSQAMDNLKNSSRRRMKTF